jgi:dodecin
MNHVYRVTEIVGSSSNSVDEAIRNGIGRATQTLRNVDWFEVTEIRGAVEAEQVSYFQVGLKIGFRLDES